MTSPRALWHGLSRFAHFRAQRRDDAIELRAALERSRAERACEVEAVIVTMARCVEGRDPATHGHCERLSHYASRLGQRLGLPAEDVDALRLGGIVHDIGKVAVPDAVLYKPGRLTAAEWAVMQRHPVAGEQICAGLSAFRRVLPIIRHHHEKMDGSGYPDGLCGEQIPLTARVLQMVDVYDALRSRRPYKRPVAARRALDILGEEVARGWRDGTVYAAFREQLLADLGLAPGLRNAKA